METISSNRPKIVVIGSCNTDMVVKANRLPVPGETILGGTFYMNPGGKGANQAIAAARLGAEVTFISKIGYDLFGLQALEIYRSEKINTEFIFTDQKSPSGVALISVDSFGENSIIVAPGASRSLSTEDINKAEEKIKEADIILMQLEVPIDTVEYAATIANRYGKKVILNPAPASTLSNSFLNNVHTILPNRIEAEMLSGIKVMDVESAHRAAKAIGEKGIENVVITLGKDGAYVKEKDEHIDKEQLEPPSHISYARNINKKDKYDKKTGYDNCSSYSFKRYCMILLIIENQHNGRDAEQIKQMHSN